MADVSRTSLPVPDLRYTGLVTYDAKSPDTSYPPIERLLPPKGAPNVLVVLLDDVGFGASSAFGGPVHTPTAERPASLMPDRLLMMYESLDVGRETGTPVSTDYGPRGNAFTGTINWVRLEAGDDDHNHLADPEHKVKIAMTKQ